MEAPKEADSLESSHGSYKHPGFALVLGMDRLDSFIQGGEPQRWGGVGGVYA